MADKVYQRTILLGLDYSNFDGNVSEVNRKMAVLKSEFQFASESAKELGNSSEELGLKQEKLTQQINLQTRKVELAREAYDKVLSKKKSTEKQIDSITIRYNKEQAALLKLKNELKEVNEQIDKNSKSAGVLSVSIDTLVDKLSGSSVAAVKEFADKLKNLSDRKKEVMIGCASLVAILGTFTTAVSKCALSSAQWADELLTTASITGLTTESLQKFQYASDLVDVSTETMSGALRKLTSNMKNAQDGSGEAGDAFKELGVKFQDANGEMRDSEEVFYELIDALGKVENETRRDALAMEIFGKSATDLNPLIEAGGAKLKALGEEAESLGRIMSDEEVNKLGELSDAMDRWKQSTEALGNSLGMIILPVLTELFEAISAIPTPVLATLVVLASVIATILTLYKTINSIIGPAKSFSDFFKNINPVALRTTAIIMGVVAALVALAVAIAAITGKGDEMTRTLESVGDMTTRMNSAVTSARNGANTISNNASGTMNFKGGATWINDGTRPEIVELPSGSKIYPNTGCGNTQNTYYVTIDARNVEDFNRVVRICDGLQQSLRKR